MMLSSVLVGFRERFHFTVAPALFQFHPLYYLLRGLVDLIRIRIISLRRHSTVSFDAEYRTQVHV